jgi:hypothetical protein
MPYPESCPECGSTFRNTGTHFTARRNEVGRHVLLELGCQNTTRRFWWDFTTGAPTEDGRPSPARRTAAAETVHAVSANNGTLHAETNGHVTLSTLELSDTGDSNVVPFDSSARLEASVVDNEDAPALADEIEPEPLAMEPAVAEAGWGPTSELGLAAEPERELQAAALAGLPPGAPASLKDAFVRQLQLDRLTLRQMRSWLMSEDSRRAIEVAAGATEATYERLALILFGIELPQLLGKPLAAPQSTGMSAEERLELQREKARIRARLRRAAAKAARQVGD